MKLQLLVVITIYSFFLHASLLFFFPFVRHQRLTSCSPNSGLFKKKPHDPKAMESNRCHNFVRATALFQTKFCLWCCLQKEIAEIVLLLSCMLLKCLQPEQLETSVLACNPMLWKSISSSAHHA
jgi:hypothetical protein